MYSILAALVAAVPVTGDEFPKEKLFTVIGVAAAVVVVLSILSFVFRTTMTTTTRNKRNVPPHILDKSVCGGDFYGMQS